MKGIGSLMEWIYRNTVGANKRISDRLLHFLGMHAEAQVMEGSKVFHAVSWAYVKGCIDMLKMVFDEINI